MAAFHSLFKYWPSRPLGNVHWSVFALLLVLWELALSGQQCRSDPRYFEVVLMTSTLWVLLWAASRRKSELPHWRPANRFLIFVFYDLCCLFLTIVLVGIPVMILTPTYQCYTARSYMSEVILSASPLRDTIANRAEKVNSLRDSGKGLVIATSKRVSGGVVSPNGVILVTSDDPPGFVVLRPRLENGAVKWICGGMPEKNLPGSCRAPLFSLLPDVVLN